MALIDIETIESQARQILDSRVESVRALVKARQQVTELQAQLAEAERENKKAYVIEEARTRQRCGYKAPHRHSLSPDGAFTEQMKAGTPASLSES